MVVASAEKATDGIQHAVHRRRGTGRSDGALNSIRGLNPHAMHGFHVHLGLDVEFAPFTGQATDLGPSVDVEGSSGRCRIVLVPQALFLGLEHTTEAFERGGPAMLMITFHTGPAKQDEADADESSVVDPTEPRIHVKHGVERRHRDVHPKGDDHGSRQQPLRDAAAGRHNHLTPTLQA